MQDLLGVEVTKCQARAALVATTELNNHPWRVSHITLIDSAIYVHIRQTLLLLGAATHPRVVI